MAEELERHQPRDRRGLEGEASLEDELQTSISVIDGHIRCAWEYITG